MTDDLLKPLLAAGPLATVLFIILGVLWKTWRKEVNERKADALAALKREDALRKGYEKKVNDLHEEQKNLMREINTTFTELIGEEEA